MDKILIKEYSDRYWSVADIFKNDVFIVNVNKFYEVNSDFILIFDTIGGSGYGHSKGKLIQKIYIGDCELIKETI